jgi:hypothetical protein
MRLMASAAFGVIASPWMMALLVRCGEENIDSKRTKPSKLGGSDPKWNEHKHSSNLVLSRHPTDGGVLVVE